MDITLYYITSGITLNGCCNMYTSVKRTLIVIARNLQLYD